MRPIDLQDHCNTWGCGVSIEHGLSCKTGGLIRLGHNDVRDKPWGLSEAALGKTYVSYEPMFFFWYGCVGFPARDAPGTCGQVRHPGRQRLR